MTNISKQTQTCRNKPTKNIKSLIISWKTNKKTENKESTGARGAETGRGGVESEVAISNNYKLRLLSDWFDLKLWVFLFVM